MRVWLGILPILGTLFLVVFFGVPFGFDLAHVTGVIDYRSLGAPELTALKAESRHWFSFLAAGCNLAALVAALVCLVLRRPQATWFLAITIIYLSIQILNRVFVEPVADDGVRAYLPELALIGLVLAIIGMARAARRRTTR